MSGLPAIAAPSEQLSIQTAAASPAAPTKEAALTTERNLFEFMAQQARTNSMGAAAGFANPAALAGQASKLLRDYMGRASQNRELNRNKGAKMDADGNAGRGVETAQAEQPQLHPGPVRQSLTSSEAGISRTDAAGGVSERDYDEIIDRLTNSMNLSLESSAVITGVANVQHSFQALLKGQ